MPPDQMVKGFKTTLDCRAVLVGRKRWRHFWDLVRCAHCRGEEPTGRAYARRMTDFATQQSASRQSLALSKSLAHSEGLPFS
jgi:hypothetical protein